MVNTMFLRGYNRAELPNWKIFFHNGNKIAVFVAILRTEFYYWQFAGREQGFDAEKKEISR